MPSLADLPDLAGFFSYSRRDDEDSDHSLSDLRKKIYRELGLQLGRDFKLFQDITIAEGTDWGDEIDRAISESVFFIPILTPRSVASKHCRLEFQTFLEREEALGRKNLVFPLLYVRVPELEREEEWRQDPLLGMMGRRQHFDWQKFRHRSITESEIAARVAQFCQNIVESLRQPWVSPAERRAVEEAEARGIAEQTRLDQEEKERQQAKAEAWQHAEQRRRATEEAEARRIAEQARLDQEEKKRQTQAQAAIRRDVEKGRQDVAEANQRQAEGDRLRRQERIRLANLKLREQQEQWWASLIAKLTTALFVMAVLSFVLFNFR
jgi:flagellar biosynthesis GTPase FlhF